MTPSSTAPVNENSLAHDTIPHPADVAAASLPLLDHVLGAELREHCGGAVGWQTLLVRFRDEAFALLDLAAADAYEGPVRRHALHRLRGAAASMAATRLEAVIGLLETEYRASLHWRLARETLAATLEALQGLT